MSTTMTMDARYVRIVVPLFCFDKSVTGYKNGTNGTSSKIDFEIDGRRRKRNNEI